MFSGGPREIVEYLILYGSECGVVDQIEHIQQFLFFCRMSYYIVAAFLILQLLGSL